MEAHIEHGSVSGESIWHIAPAENRRKDRLVRKLNGVPKRALRAVFGKVLGRRIWEQVRRPASPTGRCVPASKEPRTTSAGITDDELLLAMIESVCRRAAQTLGQHRRLARAIGLTLAYADGFVHSERARLARPSADATEIGAAAIELLQGHEPRQSPLVSLNLTTATLLPEAVLEPTPPLGCTSAPSHA
jgi:nucleotidyltransferase/DNA polymerase involved in DNA repair